MRRSIFDMIAWIMTLFALLCITLIVIHGITTHTTAQDYNITCVNKPISADTELAPIEPIPEPITIDPIPTIIPTPTPTESSQWWTDEELDMLAALIYYEAGSNDCTDRHQQLVGQVVINRMNDNRYPDTIHGVITDCKYGIQYSTSAKVLANMGNRGIIPQRCYDNALVVLNGDVECPDDIIFQANFIQGTIYEKHYTTYSVTYFCHG